ncbi:CPBP family intramembrane metalloprotease [bacterium]|nr:MAG: CPBP family intramembrane metalloprotease [bacterium]
MWYVFVLALADLTIADRIFAFLPGRFHPDPRPFLRDRLELMGAALSNQSEFLQKAASMVDDAVLLAPVVEEVLFRGLPILVARSLERRLCRNAGRWSVLTIGTFSSLFFAWLHNPFLGSMPVSILVFAILAWCVAWNWDLRNSILLHIFVNGLIYAEVLQQVMMSAG